jgi:hypothetical protein
MSTGSAGSVRAGASYWELSVSSAPLAAGLDKAEAYFKRFSASITAIGLGIGAVGAAMFAPFAGSLHTFADFTEELAKTSKRTGMSVEALQALGYAGKQCGVDMATLEMGIKRLQKELFAASQGNKEALKTFADLGVNVQDILKLTPDEQFKRMATAIGSIKDPTARAGETLKIFGKNGTALLPLLMQGGKGLDDLQKQMSALGLVMGAEDVLQGEKLADTLKILGLASQIVFSSIGAQLAPVMVSFANTMILCVRQTVGWIQAHRDLLQTLFKVASGAIATSAGLLVLAGALKVTAMTFGVAATALRMMWSVTMAIGVAFRVLSAGVALLFVPISALSLAWTVLTAVQTAWHAVALATVAVFHAMGASALLAWADILGPVLIVGIAFGALLGYTLYISGAFKAMYKTFASLGPLFRKIGAVIVQTFKGITDAVESGNIQLAFEVLWDGIKVIYATGLAWISKAWDENVDALTDAWEDMQTAIAHSWNSFVFGLDAAWTKGVNLLIQGIGAFVEGVTNATFLIFSAFAKLGDNIKTMWNNTMAGMASKMVDMQALLPAMLGGVSGPVARQKKATIEGGRLKANEDVAKASAVPTLEGWRKQITPAVDAGVAAVQRPPRDIAAEQAAVDKEIDAANRRAKIARLDLARANMGSHDVAVEKSKKDLDWATKRAAELKKNRPVMPGDIDAKAMPDEESVQKSLRKTEVRGRYGTLTAATAYGMGAGSSVDTDQLNEVKKSNLKLDLLIAQVGKVAGMAVAFGGP